MSTRGIKWDDVKYDLFTAEEIQAAELRISIIDEIAKAREEQGISQRRLADLSGIKQPMIARIEKDSTSPKLETVLKLLLPLGKTLVIAPLNEAANGKNAAG